MVLINTFYKKSNIELYYGSYIVIKYYFATQNNILCVIGYKISKEFILSSAVFYTAEEGSKKLTLLIFLGGQFEIFKTI